ncbi:MAG TPA: hypothetical protein DDY72_01340 [Verrucomicrobia bacterium]|nr:hypothetical protein [Verrucomicrobiota bacterium]
MVREGLIIGLLLATQSVCGAWWPFGSDEDEKPRLSTLMEPASLLIDKAADYADEGKVDEAVAEYRKALAELDRLEAENPERAETSEFATVRNKRAYVSAAIDSLLLAQARENAKTVAVSDTRELEAKLAAEKAGGTDAAPAVEAAKPKPGVSVRVHETARRQARIDAFQKALAADPKNRRARLGLAMEDLRLQDYDSALLTVGELLEEKPNDAAALNLRAAIEMEKGDNAAAEKTLAQAIQSNPRSYYAYYNLAHLFLKTRPTKEGRDAARRYYETGRDYAGGPVDKALESEFK